MQALVVKALSKYIGIFIKDFKKEQFNLNVLQGKGLLNDLSLNEKVLQELLLIPPNLTVRKGTCAELVVKLPSFTKLNKVPVVITLSDVNIELEEPLEIQPMPNLLAKLRNEVKEKKKEKGGQQSGWDLFNNLKIEVKEVHITVRTLIRKSLSNPVSPSPNVSGSTISSSWRPEFRVDLQNVIIQSTNSNWQVVANEKPESDPAAEFVYEYKQILCGTYSMSLVTGRARDELLPIIKDLPDVELRYKGKSDVRDNKYVAIAIDTSLPELNLSWNENQFRLMVELYASLQACFERNVPLNEDLLSASALFKKRLKGLKSIDFQYNLSIDNWVVELTDIESADETNEEEEGKPANDEERERSTFALFGIGLKMSLSPRKNVQTQDSSSQGPLQSESLSEETEADSFSEPVVAEGKKRTKDKSKNSKLDLLNSIAFVDEVFTAPRKKLYESSLEAQLTRFTFQETRWSSKGSSPTIKMLYSVDEAPQPQSPAVSLRLVHRWTKLSQPASTDIEISINGLQFVFDRKAWLRFSTFLARHPPPSFAPLDSMEDDVDEDELEKEQTASEGHSPSGYLSGVLRDFGLENLKSWYSRSKLFLKMQRIETILPVDKAVGLDHELVLFLGSLTLDTQPDWNRVPYLKDGLQLLENSRFMPYMESNDSPSNKFQISIDGFGINIRSEDESDTSCLLQPTSFSVVGRLVDLHTTLAEEFPILQLELACFFQEVSVYLTPKQNTAVVRAIELYSDWFRWVHKASEGIRARQLLEKASLEIDEQKTLEFKHTAERDALSAVELILKWFRFAVVVIAQKGSFTLPIKQMAHDVEVAILTKAGDSSAASKAYLLPESQREELSTISFEGLDLTLENSNEIQTGVVRIQSIHVEDLYMPKSPAFMFLRKLPSSERGHAVSVSLQRSLKRPEKEDHQGPPSWILAKFQNLQAISKAKTQLSPQESLQATVEYLQQLAEMLASLLWSESSRKRLEIAAKSLEYLDLSWQFDMGNCEVQLFDSLQARLPYTTLKLANFDRGQLAQQLRDVQEELIEAKLQLATSETQRDELANLIKDLRQELAKTVGVLNAERAKFKKETLNLEQQLIAAKLALVEAQTGTDTSNPRV